MISDGYTPETDCYFSMFSIQDTWEPKEESLDKYASATKKIILLGPYHFSIEFCKPKTKVINLANHIKHRQLNELIKIHSKYM